GGFYDQVQVVNVTRNVVLLDKWVYQDPDQLGDLGVGASRGRSLPFTLPADHDGEGDIQFIVTTDAGNFVKRFDAVGNPGVFNTQSITRSSVLAGDFPDLVIDPGSLELAPGSTLKTGSQITATWSDTNAGFSPTSTSWVDRVKLIYLPTGQVVATTDVPY